MGRSAKNMVSYGGRRLYGRLKIEALQKPVSVCTSMLESEDSA